VFPDRRGSRPILLLCLVEGGAPVLDLFEIGEDLLQLACRVLLGVPRAAQAVDDPLLPEDVSEPRPAGWIELVGEVLRELDSASYLDPVLERLGHVMSTFARFREDLLLFRSEPRRFISRLGNRGRIGYRCEGHGESILSRSL